MARGNVVTSVLLVSMGVLFVFAFYTYLSSMSSSALAHSSSAVSGTTSVAPISVVFAVGSYNSSSGISHVCVGVKANYRPIFATPATITVRTPSTGRTAHVATNVLPDCNIISENNICRYCFDAPISPGTYDVAIGCETCLRDSSILIVK